MLVQGSRSPPTQTQAGSTDFPHVIICPEAGLSDRIDGVLPSPDSQERASSPSSLVS